MIRLDPPPLATWILEHLTPADCDDALAGDLLEQFRAGRSSSWYWRQAIGACIAGWSTNLRARLPLLVFAALWSLLAPAWTVIVDRIELSASAGPMWHMDFPFSELPRAGSWLLLNIAFLWTGILLFVIAHSGYNRMFQHKRLLKSFALAAGLFLPVYFATFVVVNLLAWPGPVVDRERMSALAGLHSLAFWADTLRIPYFVTLVCALWGSVLRTTRSLQFATAGLAAEAIGPDSGNTHPLNRIAASRFFTFFVSAGIMNALLVSFLLCDMPQSPATSVESLLVRGGLYLSAALAGGLVGAWLYWNSPASPFRSRAPVPFFLFVAVGASAWVWMPALVLFYEQVSGAAALAGVMAALALGPSLKRVMSLLFVNGGSLPGEPMPERGLFAESLYTPPLEYAGYVTAICLCLAAVALAQRSNLTAAALAGAAAFLAAWNLTLPRYEGADPGDLTRRAVVRLALVMVPALFLTVWALMDGVGHGRRGELSAAGTVGSPMKGNTAQPRTRAGSAGGYESIVLWPRPPKREIVAPLPEDATLLAPGSQRPLVIQFDGSYWYLQPPNKQPGSNAHRAIGTPVRLAIHSSNGISITMQARQTLARPIPLSRCRAIEVVLENGDDHPGTIALAMLLENSRSNEKAAVYLGQQPIASSVSDGSRTSSVPVRDSVRFAIPRVAKIRSFDRISILILPDWDRTLTGPRIAIDEFQLFPR